MCRALVSILVVLPMLMPPGMCVCRFFQRGMHGREAGRFERAQSCQLAGCCEHCQGVPDQDDCDEHAKSETQAVTATDGPGHPGPVERHPPGCPAVQRVDHTRIVERVDHAPIVTAIETGICLSVATPSSPSVRLASPIRGLSDPPIYLDHCTLLI